MFALCSSTAITAKQASASVRREYLHLANLETHLVVGAPAAAVAQLGVVLWHELGSDAGVDDAAAEALAESPDSCRPASTRRCRSRDRAGASSSPRISSQLDDKQRVTTDVDGLLLT